jgi:hypothetical protein
MQIARFVIEMLAYGGGAAVVANSLERPGLGMRLRKGLSQRLRVEIESVPGGAMKLQDRGFDVLPKHGKS